MKDFTDSVPTTFMGAVFTSISGFRCAFGHRWKEAHMGGGMSIEMWLAEDDNAVFQSELQRNVFDEFARASTLDAGDISVSVDNRVVTLSGVVKSYPEKLEAERAAKHVRGVSAVRNELAVMLPASDQRS
jgi:BON domain